MAERVDVPAKWLREEAEAGRIPCLICGQFLRFDPAEVERVLMERAKGKSRQSGTPAQASTAGNGAGEGTR